jgi:hypothetical protein
MNTLRGWIILSWTALPAAMFGGAFLLRRVLSLSEGESSFQATWLRAFHAHGTVLIVMSLVYYTFLDRTSLSPAIKRFACAALVAGILTQSGGFLLHAIWGSPNQPSTGTAVTLTGAALLASAVIILVYGLAKAPPEPGRR